VLKQGLLTASIGIALGLVSSALLTRYLKALLFGVGSHDPVIFLGVPVLLLGVAAAACYVPARRATAVDPIAALRDS
jgi:putative ABC transport system permease protein